VHRDEFQTMKGSSMANYSLYEALKAAWVLAHPDATPAQYTAAILAIARRCGL
jgi:hypothetical protein